MGVVCHVAGLLVINHCIGPFGWVCYYVFIVEGSYEVLLWVLGSSACPLGSLSNGAIWFPVFQIPHIVAFMCHDIFVYTILIRIMMTNH